MLAGLPGDPVARRFVINLAIAFMPLAVLGLLFGKAIKAHLFEPVPVALAFIVGAFVILWAERRTHTITIHSVDEIGPLDALKLGFAQACALIPGTSRSGATIIGGLFFGLSRQAATEFSFFLAVPTLGAATVYQLYKERHLLAWRRPRHVGRRLRLRLRLGLPLRALAAALHHVARLHDLRLVPHRLRHRRAGNLAIRSGELDQPTDPLSARLHQRPAIEQSASAGGADGRNAAVPTS